jgi:hypothetical protein
VKQGLTAAKITAESAQAPLRDRKRLHHRGPPPAVPGIGTGGGFAMRIQDRQGRGPEMLAR